MPQRTEFEAEVIGSFLQMSFPEGFTPAAMTPDETALVAAVKSRVTGLFSSMKYLLGLTIDFCMTAEFIAAHDDAAKAFRPTLTKDELFQLYPQKQNARANRTQKTLSLTYAPRSAPTTTGRRRAAGPPRRKNIGIRRFEDRVVQLSRDLNRTSYPSAAPYNTQSWVDFQDVLVQCFQLSETGRWTLCNELLDELLQRLPEDRLFGRPTTRPKAFLEILRRPYDRAPGTDTENAGLTLQAIAYGYVKADRGHLCISADKVRGGSSRQRRFGDVDGYFGIDIEVSVEVKDISLTVDNWKKELGTFAKKVNYNRIDGLAIVADMTAEARAELVAVSDKVQVLTVPQMIEDVKLWDWRKQDNALNAMLHFLSHVEQNVFAVQRLLEFVAEQDPRHDMLVYREQARQVAAATDAPPAEAQDGDEE